MTSFTTQLTAISPLNSKASKSTSASGPRSAINLESAGLHRHSSLLREKGFIITKGNSGVKTRKEESVNDGDISERYLWDEPWTGSNGPRLTTETTRTEDEENATQTTERLTAEYGTATPIALTKTSNQAVINNLLKKSGTALGSTTLTQSRSIGVLPDVETLTDTSSDDTNLIIQRNQRFEEIFDTFTTAPHRTLSIGLPRATATSSLPPSSSEVQFPSPGRSWVEFDLNNPNKDQLEKRTFSWLDTESRDSVVVEDGEDVGRERVRSWKLERRADEMGWDGSI
jgi:hypothetical protein